MFEIKLTYYDNDGIIHKNNFFSGMGGTYSPKYEITEPVIETAVNSIGHFSFTVYPSHPLYEFVDKPKSIIEVKKQGREEPLFIGRPAECCIGLYNEKRLVFESELAFLLDSVRTNFNSTNSHSAKYWLEDILNYHNNHARNFGAVYTDNIQRKFSVGNVSQKILTQYTDIPAEKFKGTYTTLDIIRILLLEKYGGILKIRHKDDINYIDWLCEDDLHICGQKIAFAYNLLYIESNSQTSEIVSAIRPVGENITYDNGESKQLDIMLFDASDYISNSDICQVIDDTASKTSNLRFTDTIYSKSLVEKYGWIQKEVLFSGVVNKNALVKNAEKYLLGMIVKNSITIKAADLSGVDDEIEEFEAGDIVILDSSVNFLGERRLQINSTLLNLSDPSESEIVIGSNDAGVVSQISNRGSMISGGYLGGGYGKYDAEGSAKAALTAAKAYSDSIAENKVDKQDGKSLSTNDFTDSYKSQIDTNKSDIESLKTKVSSNASNINENSASISNLQNANVELSKNTASANQTANTAKTKAEQALARNEFTDAEKSKLAGITNPMVIKGTVSDISELPSVAEIGWFYFVGEENADYYEEYCYSQNGWEYVGLSQEGVDLSDYYTKSQIDTKISDSLTTFEGLKLKPVENKVDRNTQLIANNSGSISALDTRVTNVENEVNGLNSAVEYMSEHKASTTDVAANTNAISALDTRVTSAESKISALNITDTKHSNQITQNAMNIANNTAKIEQIKTNVTASGTIVRLDNLQGEVPFSKISLNGNETVGKQVDLRLYGKNILNPIQNGQLCYLCTTTKNGNSYTMTSDGTSYRCWGNNIGSWLPDNYNLALVNNTPVVGGKTYTLSFNIDNLTSTASSFGVIVWFSMHTSTGQVINRFDIACNETGAYSYSVNTTNNTCFIGVSFTLHNSDYTATDVMSVTYSDVQIELGDVATEFEEYKCQPITLSPTATPYVVTENIEQYDGTNTLMVSAGEISVTGVRENAAVKNVWDEFNNVGNKITALNISNNQHSNQITKNAMNIANNQAKLDKFTTQSLFYSNTTGGSSPLTVTVSNLFTNYSVVVCNIVTSNGKYSLILPLQYIKSLGSSIYYESESLLFYYVDDSNIRISTGFAQSNPTISSIKIIDLY